MAGVTVRKVRRGYDLVTIPRVTGITDGPASPPERTPVSWVTARSPLIP
jgi:hypothetical protein